MPHMTHEPACALTALAERRIANQLARVYRGTWGAKKGLELITTSLAHQMLVNGLSPDAIAGALARCVLAHPNATGAAATSNASRSLVALTAACVAQAARERAT